MILNLEILPQQLLEKESPAVKHCSVRTVQGKNAVQFPPIMLQVSSSQFAVVVPNHVKEDEEGNKEPSSHAGTEIPASRTVLSTNKTG